MSHNDKKHICWIIITAAGSAEWNTIHTITKNVNLSLGNIKYHFEYIYTRKKSKVDPDPTDPYLIFVCLAKSSAEEIGESIRSTVRKAAKLAV
jgi:hypothetical protein